MADMTDVISIESLPAMPVTLARALPILTDPDGDWDALERLIRQDEALTTAVLRLANSPRYGAPGRRFDLRNAVSRLGREALRLAVLQQQVSSLVAGENQAFGLRRGEMWRSSMAGAIAADEIARRYAPVTLPVAFTCALLRDIGKLALNAAFGQTYAAQIAAHAEPDRPFIEAERAALGFDHAQVGGALARKWNLPERIAAAIEAHHRPPCPGPGHDLLFDVVHAADTIARWAGLGVGDDGMEYTLAPHVRAAFGLDRTQAERLIALVWERLGEMENPAGEAPNKGVAA
jgi:putative nucleotidyltransferase with HDIG domain